MSSCDNESAKSVLARLRGLFDGQPRTLALGVILLAGALSVVPIRPEEIEKHMQSMSKATVVQILERKQQPPGDPPAEDGIDFQSGLEQQSLF
jgi:hypothetical protein